MDKLREGNFTQKPTAEKKPLPKRNKYICIVSVHSGWINLSVKKKKKQFCTCENKNKCHGSIDIAASFYPKLSTKMGKYHIFIGSVFCLQKSRLLNIMQSPLKVLCQLCSCPSLSLFPYQRYEHQTPPGKEVVWALSTAKHNDLPSLFRVEMLILQFMNLWRKGSLFYFLFYNTLYKTWLSDFKFRLRTEKEILYHNNILIMSCFIIEVGV